MQRAVTNQSKELNHQIRLSITPAFGVEFVGSPDRLQLRNIGNGTAMDLRPDKIVFYWSDEKAREIIPPEIRFGRIPFLRAGEEANMEHVSYAFGSEKENRNFVSRLTEENAGDKVFELKIRFRDIEGTEYKQTIFMGKGGMRPSLVEQR